MLTGKPAFRKATSAETMTAILNEGPPAVSQVAPSVPPGLQRVVNRCLSPPDRCAWLPSALCELPPTTLPALSMSAYCGIPQPRKNSASLTSSSTPPGLQNPPNRLTRLTPCLMNLSLPLISRFATPLTKEAKPLEE